MLENEISTRVIFCVGDAIVEVIQPLVSCCKPANKMKLAQFANMFLTSDLEKILVRKINRRLLF